jgi:hypothetical protein
MIRDSRTTLPGIPREILEILMFFSLTLTSAGYLPSADAVRAAFRKHMLRVHPDRSQGTSHVAAYASAAYDTLMQYLENPDGWKRRN